MAQVGWQPWATYAAEDNEDPDRPISHVLFYDRSTKTQSQVIKRATNLSASMKAGDMHLSEMFVLAM